MSTHDAPEEKHEEQIRLLKHDRDRAIGHIRQLTADLAHQRQQTDTQAAIRADREQTLLEVEKSLRDVEQKLRDAEKRLSDVHRSTSWRLTGPIRALGARNASAARVIRKLIRRSRGLWHAWRLIPLQRHPAIAAPRIENTAKTVAATSNIDRPMPLLTGRDPTDRADATTWFYIGDTIQWLQAHGQLTGVGRVTTELLFALLSELPSAQVLPCTLSADGTTLEAPAPLDLAKIIRSGLGPSRSAAIMQTLDGLARAQSLIGPLEGDHVIFTGIVWTHQYTTLFRRLASRGIRFSVLVHDIIPIERPDFVDSQYHEAFSEWLKTTLGIASVIFVSGKHIGNQIIRWAALTGVAIRGELRPIPFGTGHHAMQARGEAASAAPESRLSVRRDGFVLSVGTIDRRKNQAAMCRVWLRLLAELGEERVPQLVLVGRDDLGLASLSEAIRLAIERQQIQVIEGLSDQDLAILYRQCRFAVFSSISEGYGLPVLETLEYGKLCIASDLPAIREHAGDLAWYFAPADDDAAYRQIERAITDPAALAMAEDRISRAYQGRSWHAAAQALVEGLRAERDVVHHPNRVTTPPPAIPGVITSIPAEALRLAGMWCVADRPHLSIIIMNRNASALTLACIRQIWGHTSGRHYEILVLDNNSARDDISVLEDLGSTIRLIRLGTNRYFGEAHNIGAEEAKGPFLCLLHNDAFVSENWLLPILHVFESNPDVAAVSPLLLFPDGTVQQAGASADTEGYAIRYRRGERSETAEIDGVREVDTASAAALVIQRDVFFDVGGFDLTYEPLGYEDADLCLKIKAYGKKVCVCREAKVFHIEDASTGDDPIDERRQMAIADLNRGKFLARWGGYLRSRSAADLRSIGEQVMVMGPSHLPAVPSPDNERPSAALFTPYALTPGGGERFLLTAASVLSRAYRVTLVTPHPYSRMRLLTIGRDLAIDLTACRITTEDVFLSEPSPDLMIVMGNHVIPPVPARGAHSVFLCQFPFPLPPGSADGLLPGGLGYRSVIAYSEYTRAHIFAALSASQMPPWPIDVVYPPVPQWAGTSARKKRRILSVGRFFAGGHNKRHDLMISAFAAVLSQLGREAELHLAGSLQPDPQHIDHLETLRSMARGLPVFFHVNASQTRLASLYRDAAVYWHAAGLGAELTTKPELAEHFGISIVEAMSAECVVMAFNAGGAREIITDGEDGFLYSMVDELIALSVSAFAPETADRMRAIGAAAGRRAKRFSTAAFEARLMSILGRALSASGAEPKG